MRLRSGPHNFAPKRVAGLGDSFQRDQTGPTPSMDRLGLVPATSMALQDSSNDYPRKSLRAGKCLGGPLPPCLLSMDRDRLQVISRIVVGPKVV